MTRTTYRIDQALRSAADPVRWECVGSFHKLRDAIVECVRREDRFVRFQYRIVEVTVSERVIE